MDETAIRVNEHRHWLYATVNPGTNQFLHVGLIHTRSTQRTVLLSQQCYEKQQTDDIAFLVTTR